MKLFLSYLRQHKKVILTFGLFCLLFLVSFLLYHLPVAAVLYPALLCLLTGLIVAVVDFLRWRNKHAQLSTLQRLTGEIAHALPPPQGREEQDYQQIIRLLCQQQKQLENHMSARYADMLDYYTVWAHQIKTPISSMRLHLQNEDSPLSRQLAGDLFRIEQYAEMVLTFLRLDSDSTDYVFAEYDLDAMVKQAVKKFAGEFIGRKLQLDYQPLDAKVITDEKWLSFVIEQVLSNALKYTPGGTITISLEQPKTLCIRDTGIGIAPEDLPRIFEKGYTGYNGRSDKKASGIGLYLCKKICRNLGHSITAESVPDQGTVLRIDLAQNSFQPE